MLSSADILQAIIIHIYITLKRPPYSLYSDFSIKSGQSALVQSDAIFVVA